MKRNISYILISILLLLAIISCDLRAKFTEVRGKIIVEYPDWCCLYVADKEGIEKINADSGQYPAFGYSEWMDWQSNRGKLLHKYVDDSIITDNYFGKFRIEMLGQIIRICFNDSKSSYVEYFTYIGDYTDYYQDRLINIDTSSNEMKYSCWFRQGDGSVEFSDKCQETNKAMVIMTKINDKSYNYKLTVADEIIINVDLKNIADALNGANLEKKYSWFPTVFSEVIGTNYLENDYYGKGWIFFHNTDNVISLSVAQMIPLYCFEGISLRSIDEENKKISFYLEDRAQSDFADYFEIHITNEKWEDCPERGAIPKNRLMKGTLGFYKEGDPTPVRFYDEDHAEFKRWKP